MGSGKRFRVTQNYDFFALGIAIVPKSEHTLSIHIDLGFVHIYIGFGKGYDEQ